MVPRTIPKNVKVLDMIGNLSSLDNKCDFVTRVLNAL